MHTKLKKKHQQKHSDKKPQPAETQKFETPNQDAQIRIRGARQHNLKSVDVDIPHNSLTVITGPSGSGKSSLAFDTIYAEGQRRYVETFSPYTRQFLARMDKPQADSIEGILPAVAIEQNNNIRTSRSTVGTLTEIADYLKVLYANAATLYDPHTHLPIQPDNPTTIAQRLLSQGQGKDAIITFSIPFPATTSWNQALEFIAQQGYRRILHNNLPLRIEDFPSELLSTPCCKEISVVQDRLLLSSANNSRLIESIETAIKFGKGTVTCIWFENPDSLHALTFHTRRISSDGTIFPDPTPAHFSYNHPLGACPSCKGFGRVIGIDYDLVIPNPQLTLKEGCIKPWQTATGQECQRDLLKSCRRLNIPTDIPWHKLSQKHKDLVLHGEPHDLDPDTAWRKGLWYGVDGFFQWLESKTYKMHVRVYLSRYRSYQTCPSCLGTRFRPQTLCWKLSDSSGCLLNIAEFNTLPISQALEFLRNIPTVHNPSARRAYEETLNRLSYLQEVGLGYLTLDRPARTLSGGELQRVNLTACLGTTLTNTLFILDEPSIGLHPSDTDRIINTLHKLRDAGNTVIVVEHDPAIMRAADYLIDLGPGRGSQGGRLCASGPPAQLLAQPTSLTTKYLSGHQQIPLTRTRRTPRPGQQITLRGVQHNNIHNLDVTIPLGLLCVITGPSGSGKSTLIHDVLYKNFLRLRGQPVESPGQIHSLDGAELVREVHLVDQSPLTRTPRSNPLLFLGAWDQIRELFASTDDARSAGLNASHFSFNSGDGRCDRCQGMGYEKIEMQFLSDLYLPCPACLGKRFKPHILSVRYHGMNVHDILSSDVRTACEFYTQRHSQATTTREQKLSAEILSALNLLQRVGLTHLTLGQPLSQLSGGESQRLKLVKHLLPATKTNSRKKNAQVPRGDLILLDEPTSGLHLDDIMTLLQTLQDLVNAGHSLLIIEHHLDIIKNADYILDLGPGAGQNGGRLCASGTPEQIASNPYSPTGPYLSHTLAQHQTTSLSKLPTPAQPSNRPPAPTHICVRGARHHNLKNIDTNIPLNSWTVLTGLSGSGKSTLAFDIIFSEGQRRYLDSLNTYARQFITQISKPDVDSVTGIPPTVAISQHTTRGGFKSTVGTVTEIYHFMRLLWAKLGTQHDPHTDEPAIRQSEQDILNTLLKLSKKNTLQILSPLIKGRKGYHSEVARWATRHQIPLLRIDGRWIETEKFQPLERYKEHTIEAYIGDITPRIKPAEASQILSTALRHGRGTILALSSNGQTTIHSTHLHCPQSGTSFEELDPRLFSFHSPHGWCPYCQGLGVLPPKISQEAQTALERELELERQVEEFTDAEDTPETDRLTYHSSPRKTLPTCPHCQGTRLNPIARAVKLAGESITQISALPVSKALDWFKALQKQLSGRQATLARDILPEITQRLHFLALAGLDYLQLDRSVTTLSGGENQRIRLAAQLGSNLQGVLYVLDEPSIGLHPRDNQNLLTLLSSLRNRHNTLLVVEHDEDTMRAADHIIDLGPGAGIHGGRIIASGSWQELAKSGKSATALLLGQPLSHPTRGSRRPCSDAPRLTLSNASANNISHLSITLPLGRLISVCGPSGSGKSTLIRELLAPALQHYLTQRTSRRKNPAPPGLPQLKGAEPITALIEVDQSPIGKTSRSTPATYTGIFDSIRTLFANLPESKTRGYTQARFSYNSPAGRCPTCKGLGEQRLEMNFLPTASMTCPDCNGNRYNPATLEIRYKGKNIAEVLAMPIEEARDFFAAHASIHRTLSLLCDTGLGYLTLGQSSPTLSGGEAQRLKLVTQLARPNSTHTLYLLEEPSIGLHGDDVRKLLDLLHRLVDAGHSVIVIEHHLDILAEADWLVELGPGGGIHGGRLIHNGPPEEILHNANSPTAPFLKRLLQTSPTRPSRNKKTSTPNTTPA